MGTDTSHLTVVGDSLEIELRGQKIFGSIDPQAQEIAVTLASLKQAAMGCV